MQLIREGRFVTDTWHRPLAGEAVVSRRSQTSGAAVAADGGERYLLQLDRLLAEGDVLAATGCALGVEIPNDAELSVLEPWLGRLELIVVAFPKFVDGRGFSVAARLRRSGFRGELRASGHIIADQYALAKSSGFDTVEIPVALAERQPELHWIAATNAISLAYQQEPSELRNILAARWEQRSNLGGPKGN